jgi:hypothetical protein
VSMRLAAGALLVSSFEQAASQSGVVARAVRAKRRVVMVRNR